MFTISHMSMRGCSFNINVLVQTLDKLAKSSPPFFGIPYFCGTAYIIKSNLFISKIDKLLNLLKIACTRKSEIFEFLYEYIPIV